MPSNYIKLMKNIPLDSSYEHTLYFASEAAQSNYFDSAAGVVKDNLTITRIASNKLRVSGNSEKYRDYNYILINNTEFDGKRIYAFIKDIEYVNNGCFNVIFEIDVMQTYAFDYTLRDCFVERNHVSDDTIGAHTVQEPINSGDYIRCMSEEHHGFGDCTQVGILTWYDMQPTPQKSPGFFYAGIVFIPGTFDSYPITSQTALSDYFKRCDETGYDNIIDIFQYPTGLDDTTTIQEKDVDIVRVAPFGAYTPKNNKLYTYPYCFITLSNNDGQSAVYRWHDFTSNSKAQFKLIGALLPEPSMIMMPHGYKGLVEDYDAGLTITNFPHLAWSTDVKTAYLNQNSNQLAMKAVSAGVNAIPAAASGAASGGMVGGPYGAIAGAAISAGTSLLSTFATENAKQKDLEAQPPQMHGSLASDTIKIYTSRYVFTSKQFGITPEYARVVDDFFTRFGYQVNRVMTPHTHNRQNFSYVKTGGCSIRPLNVPYNAAQKICSIFDNGITFWKNPANVGDYSVSNDPV